MAVAATSPMLKFFRQLKFVCHKNLILQARYWKSTLTQAIVAPLIVLIVLVGLQAAVNSLQEELDVNPQRKELGAVPPCTNTYRSTNKCVTMMYAPKTDNTVSSIMETFLALNNKRSSFVLADDTSSEAWPNSVSMQPTANLGLVGVDTEEFIYEYSATHPNVTGWAVFFDITTNAGVKYYRYTLWYNSTSTARVYPIPGAPPFVPGVLEPVNDEMLSVVRALDEAIIAVETSLGSSNTVLDVQTKDFPQITTSSILVCPRNPDGALIAIGPVFLFVGMVVVFFTTVNTIVTEKESHLKESLEMVGMYSSVFWLAQFATSSLLVLVNAIATVVLGYAFGLTLFRNADLGALLFFFIMYGLAFLSMALFVSSVTSKVRTAIGFGFFIVILSTIYIALGSIATYVWYVDPAIDPLFLGWVIQMFIPYFNYNKFIRDAFSYTSKSVGRVGPTCKVIDGSWFGWTEIASPANVAASVFVDSANVKWIPQPSESLWLLFMNICLYWVLTLYLDKVLPNENGYREHPLFFLKPSFYGFKDPVWMRSTSYDKPLPEDSVPPADEDVDVVAERTETNEKANDGAEVGLKIAGLHKKYGKFTAVNELTLNVNKGDLLSLLGSNGAGKTSTMKIMYGVSPPTLGNAWIFGMDVRTQMRDIRKILGVCPQFDVLYPDLTALEHLRLFCGIKGISAADSQAVIEERLKHMKLWNVRDQRSTTYSGGMKRRLSVILSTLGDPQYEPTTGMDPVNKRYVWSFIENFKKGRVIILTTHSMEEADILGDKIAIMSKGRLKAVGSALRLKNKFGDGYRVSLVVPRSSDVPAVKAIVAETTPQALLIDEEYVGGDAAKKSEGAAAVAAAAKGAAANATSAKSSKKSVSSSAVDGVAAVAVDAGQTARLVYTLKDIKDVKRIVRVLEDDQKLNAKNGTTSMVSGWGMSQTSLEDVFLQMIK